MLSYWTSQGDVGIEKVKTWVWSLAFIFELADETGAGCGSKAFHLVQVRVFYSSGTERGRFPLMRVTDSARRVQDVRNCLQQGAFSLKLLPRPLAIVAVHFNHQQRSGYVSKGWWKMRRIILPAVWKSFVSRRDCHEDRLLQMSWKRSRKWPEAAEQLITLITLDLQFTVSRIMKEYALIVWIISCLVLLEIKELSAVETIVREAERLQSATTPQS